MDPPLPQCAMGMSAHGGSPGTADPGLGDEGVRNYWAYGLEIRSALSLPEFVRVGAGKDVTIRCSSADYIPPGAEDRPWCIQITREEAVLFFRDVASFRVRDGREILIRRAPAAQASRIRLYLVGTVMAVLLYQREMLVLHASVVDIDGAAVAFLGTSGAGKSSLAAALHARGHPVLVDDVAAVDTTTGTAMVIPAFPQLKLHPAVARSLGYDAESLLLLHPTEEKRGYRMSQASGPAPVPLGQIYILAANADAGVETLPPCEALVELIRHSYPSRLLHSGGAPHLHQCTDLVRNVPIARLKKSPDPASLPYLAELVEASLVCGRRSARMPGISGSHQAAASGTERRPLATGISDSLAAQVGAPGRLIASAHRPAVVAPRE
jgi:hypothetical protein